MVWRTKRAAASKPEDNVSGQQVTVTVTDQGVLSTMAPRLARGIVAAVFTGFCVVALLHVVYSGRGPRDLILAALYMAFLLTLQVVYFSRPVAQLRRRATTYIALAVQAMLVYLPLLEYKVAWIGLPGFLAGSVLLVLPPALAWTAFTLVVLSMAYIQSLFSDQLIDVAYTTVATIMTGLVVYGLTRLANLLTELNAARTELARMAVAEERLRFARDLHDLLGYSLSAITLKSELTHRLVPRNPEKAKHELAEILDISRKALTDVRSVASGYRELSLDAESESARSVLVAADVEVQMELDYGDLPPQLRTVLATVLREGVTNVLRHSKAERCEISVRQIDGTVALDIVNDGVHQNGHVVDGSGGAGLRNLCARIESLNGELHAGVDEVGRYHLHAFAPVPHR